MAGIYSSMKSMVSSYFPRAQPKKDEKDVRAGIAALCGTAGAVGIQFAKTQGSRFWTHASIGAFTALISSSTNHLNPTNSPTVTAKIIAGNLVGIASGHFTGIVILSLSGSGGGLVAGAVSAFANAGVTYKVTKLIESSFLGLTKQRA